MTRRVYPDSAAFMQYVAQLVLLFIHAIYGLKNLLFSFIPSRNPKPLLARRKKVPGHIAFILVPNAVNSETGQEEAVMEQCIESAIKWCKTLGISHLSIYERDGRLLTLSRCALTHSCSHFRHTGTSLSICVLGRIIQFVRRV